MTNPRYDDEVAIGSEWKEYWRELEKDPSKRREIRIAKRNARRAVHKKRRRQSRADLKHWDPDE